MNLLFFGDSITQGFWDIEGGWVSRIRTYYDTKRLDGNSHTPIVFNLGVSGDTSNGVAGRIEAEIRARKHHDVTIVIAIGVNDSQLKRGVAYSDVAVYRDNLHKILGTARQFSAKLLFIGLTPCIEERTSPVSWGEYVYTNARIQEFDKALRMFCYENAVKYISMSDFVSRVQIEKDLLPDGIHPNATGHQVLYEIILPEVEKLLS